jgi:hypothetical protein
MIQSARLPLETWRIFCNNCNRDTNHRCRLHEYSSDMLQSEEEIREVTEHDPDFEFVPVFEIKGYRLWVCAGCDTWTVEEYFAVVNEGDEDSIFDRNYIEATFIPERTKFHAQAKHFHQLTPKLTEIYKEILHSYNNNLPVLCAVGIRALLEGICADRKIQGTTVAQKIEGLSVVLPPNIVNHLHGLRFMGNEAAHELIPPDQEELHLAISLIEDLLNFLYELDYRASSLTEWQKKKRADDKTNKSEPLEPDKGSR